MPKTQSKSSAPTLKSDVIKLMARAKSDMDIPSGVALSPKWNHEKIVELIDTLTEVIGTMALQIEQLKNGKTNG